MAIPVVRRGDRNSAGGVLTQGHGNILVNSRPAGKQGGRVTPHPCCPRPGCGIHCNATAAYSGSKKVLMNGIPGLRVGADKDSCGHPRATGSSNVRIG